MVAPVVFVVFLAVALAWGRGVAAQNLTCGLVDFGSTTEFGGDTEERCLAPYVPTMSITTNNLTGTSLAVAMNLDINDGVALIGAVGNFNLYQFIILQRRNLSDFASPYDVKSIVLRATVGCTGVDLLDGAVLSKTAVCVGCMQTPSPYGSVRCFWRPNENASFSFTSNVNVTSPLPLLGPIEQQFGARLFRSGANSERLYVTAVRYNYHVGGFVRLNVTGGGSALAVDSTAMGPYSQYGTQYPSDPTPGYFFTSLGAPVRENPVNPDEVAILGIGSNNINSGDANYGRYPTEVRVYIRNGNQYNVSFCTSPTSASPVPDLSGRYYTDMDFYGDVIAVGSAKNNKVDFFVRRNGTFSYYNTLNSPSNDNSALFGSSVRMTATLLAITTAPAAGLGKLQVYYYGYSFNGLTLRLCFVGIADMNSSLAVPGFGSTLAIEEPIPGAGGILATASQQFLFVAPLPAAPSVVFLPPNVTDATSTTTGSESSGNAAVSSAASSTSTTTDVGAIVGGLVGGGAGLVFLLLCGCCGILACIVALLLCCVVVVAMLLVAATAVAGVGGGTTVAAAAAGGIMLLRKRQNEADADPWLALQEYLTKTADSIRLLQFEDLKFEERIGEGAFGVVFRGRWRRAEVAIKVLNFSLDEGEIDDFKHEAETMQRLGNHPNIVSFIGAVIEPDRFILVMEYCRCGALSQYLQAHGSELTAQQLLAFAVGAASGIAHLHAEGVVHRDIAARNCLLSSELRVHISDFGTSRFCEIGEENVTKSNIGPVRWMAPESLKVRRFSSASDVWSFGVLLFEVYSGGKTPFEGQSILDVAYGVANQNLRLDVPQGTDPAVAAAMTQCWQTDPAARPSMSSLFETLNSLHVELYGELHAASTLAQESVFDDTESLHSAASTKSLVRSQYISTDIVDAFREDNESSPEDSS